MTTEFRVACKTQGDAKCRVSSSSKQVNNIQNGIRGNNRGISAWTMIQAGLSAKSARFEPSSLAIFDLHQKNCPRFEVPTPEMGSGFLRQFICSPN
jgi:hypothetical protein